MPIPVPDCCRCQWKRNPRKAQIQANIATHHQVASCGVIQCEEPGVVQDVTGRKTLRIGHRITPRYANSAQRRTSLSGLLGILGFSVQARDQTHTTDGRVHSRNNTDAGKFRFFEDQPKYTLLHLLAHQQQTHAQTVGPRLSGKFIMPLSRSWPLRRVSHTWKTLSVGCNCTLAHIRQIHLTPGNGRANQPHSAVPTPDRAPRE